VDGPFSAAFRVWFWDCLQPIEGRSKRIGTSTLALIRNASLDDFVLGVDEFPVPTLAVRQEAIEAVRGLVGQSARSDTGGSATGLSATDAWLRAAAGDVEQRSRVEASSKSNHYPSARRAPDGWRAPVKEPVRSATVQKSARLGPVPLQQPTPLAPGR
jgi:hypothetical protein